VEEQTADKSGNEVHTIDAGSFDTRQLNQMIRESARKGYREIVLHNVAGQRYIGAGLQGDVRIDIYGTPGNDLGAFMDGPTIRVHGNAQDGCGNTMNKGEIVIDGDVGDITGLSARGGRIFVRGDAGYRTAVHMKEFQGSRPTIVIGGTTSDFLGEYMAGGVVLLLGMGLDSEVHRADFVGTGMHGGVIFILGDVRGVGREVAVLDPTDEDIRMIEGLVNDFASHFDCDVSEVLGGSFRKMMPVSSRPYGALYTY
jgi:glutamate synthase domain-containing protein 3